MKGSGVTGKEQKSEIDAQKELILANKKYELVPLLDERFDAFLMHLDLSENRISKIDFQLVDKSRSVASFDPALLSSDQPHQPQPEQEPDR